MIGIDAAGILAFMVFGWVIGHALEGWWRGYQHRRQAAQFPELEARQRWLYHLRRIERRP